MLTPNKSSESAKPEPIIKGKPDHFMGYFGVPGCGKSTEALKDTIELANEWHAFAIAYDPGRRLPDVWPDGGATGVKRYESIEALRKGLETDATGVHALATVDPEPLIRFVMDLTAQSLADHGNTAGYPVVFLLDEAVSHSGVDPFRLNAYCRECKTTGKVSCEHSLLAVITLRRHKMIMFKYTCQSPTRVHYTMLELATSLKCGRLRSDKALDKIRELQVDEDTIHDISRLPKYEFIEIDLINSDNWNE